MKCVDRVWIVLGFLFCSLGSAGGSLRLAEDNIDEIVRQMSPREKAMLLVGCESLVSKDSLTVYVPGAAGYTKAFPQYGIPSTVMADGPVGVRIFLLRSMENVIIVLVSRLRLCWLLHGILSLWRHKPEQWAKRLLFMMSMSY